MKKTKIKLKYIWLLIIVLGFTACNEVEDILEDYNVEIPEDEVLPELTSGSVDFSNYVALGASFTAGFSDNGLFIAGQENSFPNTLSKQFAKVGGGSFTQPLMNDNTGGILVGGVPVRGHRLVFDGAGPVGLDEFLTNLGIPVPPITTEAGINIGSDFNNFGIPGAKSFHLITQGYAAFNPFYARIASSPAATVLEDAVAQSPSFFTLSEVGGNDVLGYALSGGSGVSQEGNLDPSTYGPNDLTDSNVFAATLSGMVDALTANGAKGAIANVPCIKSLPHFTTVPYNPLDPSNPAFGPQIPTLNLIYGALNQIFALYGETNRIIVFSEDEASAVVVRDESLEDFSAQIAGALAPSPEFAALIGQFGLPPAAAPQVAGLLGFVYGQARQATEADLFVLPSSSVIGTVNTDSVMFLMSQGLSQTLAGQFSVEGVSLPLEDKWVVTPTEQQEIGAAVTAYNSTISSIASANGLALVDLDAILQEAASTGISSGDFDSTTDLVTGGLVSLDGVHLTARGYAIMANAFLEAIDAAYGSNFIASGNAADVGEFGVGYPPLLP